MLDSLGCRAVSRAGNLQAAGQRLEGAGTQINYARKNGLATCGRVGRSPLPPV